MKKEYQHKFKFPAYIGHLSSEYGTYYSNTRRYNEYKLNKKI